MRAIIKENYRKYSKMIWTVTGFCIVVYSILDFFIALRTGHPFNEDYAVYLKQSSNLLDGNLSQDMGIIYNADFHQPLYTQSPIMYPWLLPIIFSPILKVFELDIEILKIQQILLLFCALLLFLRTAHSWGFAAFEAAICLLAFSQYHEIWRSIQSLGSDLPFLLFLMIALRAIDRATMTNAGWLWMAGAGGAIFLATEMRVVGGVLLPALWLTDMARQRRWFSRPAVVAGAVFAALWAVEHALLPGAGSYRMIAHYPFFTPLENLRQFYWALAKPFAASPLRPVLETGLLAGFTLAAVAVPGAVRSGNPAVIFLCCYTAALLVLPNFGAGARYLVPILLFFPVLAMRGAALLAGMVAARAAQPASFLTAALLVAMFAASAAPYPPGPLPFGVGTPAAQDAFAAVRERLSQGEILGVSKFRSFHLFTGRRTIIPPYHATAQGLRDWAAANQVSAVMIKESASIGPGDSTDCPENPLCTDRTGFTLIWHNKDFSLLRRDPT